MSDKLQRRLKAIEQVKSQELEIGEAVKVLRKSIGLTQTEFSRVIKVAPRVLMELERGRGNPTLETLSKIAKAFGFKVGFVKVEVDR